MFEEESVVVEVIVQRPTMKFAHFPPICLVGPMGAGKTTIGKLLAKHLRREFVDCDWYIANQAGTDIPWIFAKEGEAGFRQRETQALKTLMNTPNAVIATGGGVVTRAENRELLKQGVVIFLDANVDTQLLRTKKDTNRPLLQTENPRAVLEKLYHERKPLYLEVADMVVLTGKSYPKQMLLDIIDALEQYNSLNYVSPKS